MIVLLDIIKKRLKNSNVIKKIKSKVIKIKLLKKSNQIKSN